MQKLLQALDGCIVEPDQYQSISKMRLHQRYWLNQYPNIEKRVCTEIYKEFNLPKNNLPPKLFIFSLHF